MDLGPDQEPITKTELTIIRWIEKILTPLLVLAIGGLFAFYVQINQSVAQIEAKASGDAKSISELTDSVKELDKKQDQMLHSQHEMSKTLEGMGTTQRYYKEQIDELKVQNREILRILREERR